MADVPAGLLEAFDALFISPFVSRHWASARGRSHWVEQEGYQDAIAGPLSAVAQTGGCEYVYPREDGYFTSVVNPASLRAKLLEWHAGLAAGVERFAPAMPGEAADLEFMQSVVGRIRELVERVCVVEQARWQTARQAEPSHAADSARTFASGLHSLPSGPVC